MKKMLFAVVAALGFGWAAEAKVVDLNLRPPAAGGARRILSVAAKPEDALATGVVRSYEIAAEAPRKSASVAGASDAGADAGGTTDADAGGTTGAGATGADAGATGADADAAIAVGDVLKVSLFDDIDFEITITARNESAVATSFLGAIDGVVCATVIPRPAGFFIDIQDIAKNLVYKILPGEAVIRVKECDPSLAPKRDESIPAPASAPAPSASEPSASVTSATDSDATATDADATERGKSAAPMLLGSSALFAATVVDVMVVYDTGAAAWVANEGSDCETFAEAAVAKANAALANTGLDECFQFRLVCCTNVAVAQTDLLDALNAIVCSETGYGEIAAMREAVGADLVVHLIDTGSAYGTTGRGWALNKDWRAKIAQFKDYAFSVSAVRSVAISHTMTHEIGHNMGAGHSNKQYDSPGPQLYSYSSGYYFTGTNGVAYHTIMAYGDDGYGNRYTAFPGFSSPDWAFMGKPVGIDGVNDNSLTISNVYPYTAAYFDQKIPLTYGVTFSPETGSLFSDYLDVTITAMQPGDKIYYTLDGSTPTASSAPYTAPIRITGDTTIKAITVDSAGNPSRVFTAKYAKSPLGNAVNQPSLAWNTTSQYPWVSQSTNTHDGVSAAQIVFTNFWVGAKLWTTVTGPKQMSFWYQTKSYKSPFKVYLDNNSSSPLFEEILLETRTPEWRQVEVSIPSGKHTVNFEYTREGYFTNVPDYVVLDEIEFDAYAPRPTISPLPAAGEEFYDFTGSQTVTIQAQPGQRIFYTTDGADPVGQDSEEYTGPFTVTRTTEVRAIATQPGKKNSVIVSALFRERHPIAPGEWTTDVEGAVESARTNGCNLTLTLCANLATCWYCQQFDPIAESPEFLAWARANKIYLITADQSRYIDAADANTRFWAQWNNLSSGYVYYPTITVANSSDTPIAWFRARPNETYNGVTYVGTVDSLIKLVASYLGATPLAAPVALPAGELVGSFPVSVTLSNTNATGTIYYTLDGSAPSATHGTRYTGGAISITSSAQTLTAVVVPSGSSAVTGIPLVKNYQTFGEALGISGGTFSTTADYPWVKDPAYPNALRSVYVKGATYTSSLTGTFSGKGKLIYTCKGSANTGKNYAKVTVDGTQVFYKKYDGATTVKETVITNNFTTGNHTVVWSYTVVDPNYNFDSNGCFIRDAVWIPESQATTNECPVPYTWLDRYYGASTARTPAEYQALADADSDGDGYLAWEEYLCGTDPTDAASRLTLNIRFDASGAAKVDYAPTNSAATYQKQGSPSLPPVWGAPSDASRFFRVLVTPK